jgi:O-methyltransferase involved in polyketide biosynthesis
MKIALKEEMETLLIPLYGKAQMSRKGIFRDRDAEEAVAQIDYDFSRLHIQEKTQVMLSIRAALMDDFAAGFLKEHPHSAVLHLGCGLDARARRLGVPIRVWYDLDFPQVIDIKRQLYEETENYRYIPSSVTDLDWMHEVDTGGFPLLVVAEGLFMYLAEEDIKELLLKMQRKFKDVTLIFDTYSKLTASKASRHPSLKRTGAVIRWGVDSPAEIEAFGSGIIHQKTLYLTDKNAISCLPAGYRTIFALAGNFKAAKEAHRIFIMNLRA